MQQLISELESEQKARRMAQAELQLHRSGAVIKAGDAGAAHAPVLNSSSRLLRSCMFFTCRGHRGIHGRRRA